MEGAGWSTGHSLCCSSSALPLCFLSSQIKVNAAFSLQELWLLNAAVPSQTVQKTPKEAMSQNQANATAPQRNVFALQGKVNLDKQG